MDRLVELNSIQEYSDHYLQVNEKSLCDRLDELEVDGAKQIQVIKDNSKKSVKEVGKSVVNSVPVAAAISKAAFIFIDWNEKIDKDLEDVKKKMLIESYLNKVDRHEKYIENLKEAMTDFYGNALINKIFRMLSDYPPDAELFKNLQSALEEICESKNFKELFDVHKFNLGLIEKMSPQSLSVLADKSNWPNFSFNFVGMDVGGEIKDQFQMPFAKEYSRVKGINEEEKIERVSYIINELLAAGFIKCYKLNSDIYTLRMTKLGTTLCEYLSTQ